MKLRVATVVFAAALAACGTQNAVFITKTSISVLDVDATPSSASIAHDRTEGYFGPRFEDGSVYPVTGYFNTTGAGLTRKVKQVFAGGEAATVVLGANVNSRPPKPCNDDRNEPPLLFATGTTIGIKVGFVEGAPLPNSFVFGYRRKEAATVPVSKDCHPSVLATLDSEGSARTETNGPKLKGNAGQYFATGAAATLLAQDRGIRNMFKEEAQRAIGAAEAFNEREAAQLRLTLAAVECAARVPDGRFDRVITNADELSLFAHPSDGTFVRAAASPSERLQRYSGRIRLRMGDEDPRTSALEVHKKRVCDLAAQG
jgi:hypothetical protein